MTEQAAAEVLSLPVHPALSRAQLDHVVAAVNRWAVAGSEPHLARGIIGLGQMGSHHVRVLRCLPDVDLVGGRRHPATGTRCWRASTWSTRSRSSSTGASTCACVATPTVTHEPIGLQLAEAGVATLIEKPLAHDTKAAQNIAEAFARTATLSCVGHIERFNPALQEMRQRLAGGELGNLYQVVTRRQGPFPDRIVDAGVILDLATHDIDLTAWVTGCHLPVGVGAIGAPQRPPARRPGQRGRGAVQRAGRRRTSSTGCRRSRNG